jgi:hypothetical protein
LLQDSHDSFHFADLKHEFGHVPRLITAETGEDIALSCFPPEGNPRPLIRWRRAGGSLLPLDNTDKYRLDPSGVLLIRRPTRQADAGQYECLVTNEEGTRVDSPVTLEILDPRPSEDGSDSFEEMEEYDDPEEEDEETVPEITEAELVDRVTGVMRWRPVPGAAGYLVLVTAEDRADQPGVVANISLEPAITQVKLHSLDPDVVYRVAVAAITGDGHQPPVFSAGRLLKAGPGRQTSILREFTIRHPATAAVDDGDGLVAGVPAHIWFLAVAVAVLLTVLVVLAAGILCQRTAGCRRKDDPEMRSGRTTPCSSIASGEGGGNSRTYYYCSGGNSSSWMERRWGGAADGAEKPFQTFKSDRHLLATDNHYDYVLQSSVDRGTAAAAARDAAEAYQYFSHYASVPIVKPTAVKKPLLPDYTVLLPLDESPRHGEDSA